MSEATRILESMDGGDPRAAEELLPLVYDELRRPAAGKLSLERPGQTLQATALVHEAYLRLVKENRHDWNGRRHFYCVAAEVMRRILVDRARKRQSRKHGGEWRRVPLDSVDGTPGTDEGLWVEVQTLREMSDRGVLTWIRPENLRLKRERLAILTGD